MSAAVYACNKRIVAFRVISGQGLREICYNKQSGDDILQHERKREMIYTVLKIEEDLDYGCEERSEDQQVTVLVTLQSSDREKSTCRMPDQLLYDRDINEGDKVIFDEEGLLRKPLGEDWTSYCNDKNTDIAGFVNWMQEAKSGKEIRKVCPFCGGKVAVISNRDGHTVIGCDSCDMRIELDGASL